MKLKPTVKFGNPVLAMSTMLLVVDGIFKSHGYDCIITSFNDSKHGATSLHPEDEATDFRTKHIPDSSVKELIYEEIKASLTTDFDVVFEFKGGEQEHIHVEYDKK